MKYRLSLFLFLLPLCLGAAPVSADRAGKMARQFLRAEGSRSSSVRLLAEQPYSTKSASANPPYYIFEGDRGGFVVLAADDRVSPVIGWSANGAFRTEGMPENIRAWLNMWREIILSVQDGKLAAQSGVDVEWDALEKGKQPLYASGKELETANWNQGSPYNSFCPDYNGNVCVTGCVATATAIIMRYHKWPKAGTGTLPAYDYVDDNGTSRSVSSVKLGHDYDWNNMPLTVDESTPADAQKEVARLIFEVGVMINSNYNPGGTAAWDGAVYPGLATYFDYDASAFHYLKSYYDDDEWKRMMIENIENVGPVLYSGASEEEGHAFVLDGYNAQGQFRINWGWGGYNNGYYTLPAFDDFTVSHAATLNLRKNEGGKIMEALIIDGASDEEDAGLTCSTSDFQLNVPFDITCRYVYNVSSRPFTGKIAFGVVHRDGSVGEIIDALDNDITIPVYSGVSFRSTEAVITEPILIGDVLCVLFSSANTPEWTRLRTNIEDKIPGEVPIADAQSIEEVTSLRYTSATGILIISTKEGVSWQIKDKQGTAYTQGVDFSDGVLTIDTNRFKADTYVLTLTKGYDSKSVEFVFGKQ